MLIFSHLLAHGLRALRLVCRAFRQASNQCIKSLRLEDGNNSCVDNAISAFPGLAAMTLLHGDSPPHQPWPQSVSKLRSLIVYDPSILVASCPSERLPLHSGLTSLALLQRNIWNGHYIGNQDILSTCPALRVLEVSLFAFKFEKEPGYHHGILRLTALQELRIFQDTKVWRSLLPRLTCLTLLGSLSGACVDTAEDLSALVALTQLTALGALMRPRHWISCLQQLTRLVRVAIVIPWPNFIIQNRPEDIEKGPLLEDLSPSLEWLCLWDSHVGGSRMDLIALSVF